MSGRSFRRSSVTTLGLLGLVASFAGGCQTERVVDPVYTVQQFIRRVSTVDGQVLGVLRPGRPPVATPTPTVSVETPPALVVGASGRAFITASETFQTVYVAVDSVDGYYEITLPASATGQELLFTLSTEPPLTEFSVAYGVLTASGLVGGYDVKALRLIPVGTGDVQVSVVFDANSDVDLYVTDPSGEQIFYGNRTSASGGELDLDSNADCQIDAVNNENIVFPDGTAPRGTYAVYVDYFASCGVPRTNYVVTIQVVGQEPQTFTGTFTGTAESNPRRLVGTFTY